MLNKKAGCFRFVNSDTYLVTAKINYAAELETVNRHSRNGFLQSVFSLVGNLPARINQMAF